ncbi:bifunctional adenosylcobinamide kinase/adenosylcobinamide-phosphate guanylyltransferase [Sphingomonas desiccabilis]|uniref:Bifunctional adenosylcobalamin biosynthesis protein n=2 Tax=Sphingomonas desiccabilis TaxID=429134 RepID=A0A4V1QQ13_9SPHN|nr:bifunctional adenosylcobinamide kinase/adenosylcobinamide-phosphate guanylyltransferase [Sphingomonas desiccabilis]
MLVLGGARSGKSRYAQAVAEAAGGRLVFVATAQAFDAEMTDRIRRHQADRDHRWTTVDAPVDLAGAISAVDAEDTVVLIDCLTLWASNLLLGDEDGDARLAELAEVLGKMRAKVLLVANEVGLGIVPDNALARRFRDLAGTINQRIAAIADRVHMTVAGIPIVVK